MSAVEEHVRPVGTAQERRERRRARYRRLPQVEALMLAMLCLLLSPLEGRAQEEWPSSAAGEGYQPCWHSPAPATLEEAAYALKNAQRRNAKPPRAAASSAMLALSGGARIAYGAGLLVGWGETGQRPEFVIVTAVGGSVMIAPFAFLGAEGDQRIADLINCHEREDLASLAREASRLIDTSIVAAIARRHKSGARLIVGLPGSAARRESVWDVGAIAASGHPGSVEQIRKIVVSAADLASSVDPGDLPIAAGAYVTGNPVFRTIGAGEPFIWPWETKASIASLYLIHNAVLFGDESDEYIAKRGKHTESSRIDSGIWLRPAADILAEAERRGTHFRFASLKPGLNIAAGGTFGGAYHRRLFLHAYRQGRMGGEWRKALPTRSE